MIPSKEENTSQNKSPATHNNSSSRLEYDTNTPEQNMNEQTEKSNNTDEDLVKKLKAFEVTLYQREEMAKELERERNSQIALNDVLCLEIDELRRMLCGERNRSRAHIRRLVKLHRQEPTSVASTIPGLEEDKSVVYYMLTNLFSRPRALLVGAASRVTLYCWWLGKWINEGLSIWKIENKWMGLQQVKTRLEEEKLSLEEHAFYLQQLLEEKEEAIQREKELNSILKQQLEDTQCRRSTESNGDMSELKRSLDTLLDKINILGKAVDELNRRMEGTSLDLEGIYKKVRSITSSQKRLESHERNLEEHLKEMLEVIARMQMREEKRYFRDACYRRSVRLHENRCARCHSFLGSTGVVRSSSFPNKVSLEMEAKHRVKQVVGSQSDGISELASKERLEERVNLNETSLDSRDSSTTSSEFETSSAPSSYEDESFHTVHRSTIESPVEESSARKLSSPSVLFQDSIRAIVKQITPRTKVDALITALIGLCFFIILVWHYDDYKARKDSTNELYNKNSSFAIALFSIMANVGRLFYLS